MRRLAQQMRFRKAGRRGIAFRRASLIVGLAGMVFVAAKWSLPEKKHTESGHSEFGAAHSQAPIADRLSRIDLRKTQDGSSIPPDDKAANSPTLASAQRVFRLRGNVAVVDSDGEIHSAENGKMTIGLESEKGIKVCNVDVARGLWELEVLSDLVSATARVHAIELGERMTIVDEKGPSGWRVHDDVVISIVAAWPARVQLEVKDANGQRIGSIVLAKAQFVHPEDIHPGLAAPFASLFVPASIYPSDIGEKHLFVGAVGYAWKPICVQELEETQEIVLEVGGDLQVISKIRGMEALCLRVSRAGKDVAHAQMDASQMVYLCGLPIGPLHLELFAEPNCDGLPIATADVEILARQEPSLIVIY